MKRNLYFAFIALVVATAVITSLKGSSNSPEGEPWKPEQLMKPADLAERLKDGKDVPVIINIGPSGVIKSAIDIGPGQEASNIAKLDAELAKLSKDAEVVIYCGCCPFKNCPNIRPAFESLNKSGIKNVHLLNLSENLRVDWIAKGYPMAN
jgi:hypothetical protein